MAVTNKDLLSLASYDDIQWMKKALSLAQKAFHNGDVPVGAIVVSDSMVLGKSYNQREKKEDPLAHAEFFAIQKAVKHIKSWRFPKGVTLYTTLEPCHLCTSLIIETRISRVVVGASAPDERKAMSYFLNLIPHSALRHVVYGVMKEESALLIQDFFRLQRKKNKSK